MTSKPKFHHLLLMLFVVCSLSSCKAIKKFLSTNLDDEDYIVGQLYADELVNEKPVRSRSQQPQGQSAGASSNPCGIDLNDKDNPKLYEAINAWFGTPYLYGGCTTSGVDCSCFVGNVFKSVYGITLHRTANDIQKDMDSFVARNKLREGDVLFFVNSNGKVSHVAIYLKDDLFVHSSTSHGVAISSLENSYWKKHFYKAGRHKSVKTKY